MDEDERRIIRSLLVLMPPVTDEFSLAQRGKELMVREKRRIKMAVVLPMWVILANLTAQLGLYDK
ncbi:hypothetical protein CPB86DRAFT_781572 [Serendipita vermifera]|nr:hypothetical protein CPB86DRAFT_781572 [Serendipita vermifera]